jgi:UDP-glucose 4-epimerase
MATYLVTGGCGFIGSHLCNALLSRGDAIRILDDLSTGSLANLPAAAEFFQGDVADSRLVLRAMAGVDGCFHLAAIASVELSNSDWLRSHRTNLTGAITVFDAAPSLPDASRWYTPPPLRFMGTVRPCRFASARKSDRCRPTERTNLGANYTPE